MDTAQWPQEILVKPVEEMIPNSCSSSVAQQQQPGIIPNSNNNGNNNSSNSKPSSTSLERKVRPQKDHALNCPRCNSTNTKFCYYNNYSLTQPRYFCKTCRRYWTDGGSLRNIPVGGGSRKNKRSSSSSSSSPLPSTSLAIKRVSSHDLAQQNPKILQHQGQDLNLGFNPIHNHPSEFRNLSDFMQLPTIETAHKGQTPNSSGLTTISGVNHHFSALELLNGLTSTRGINPFMSISLPEHGNGVYSSGFPSLQDYKPASLNFSLVDGVGNGYGGLQGEVHHQASGETNNGRLLFPFEDLKQVSSTTSGDLNNKSADNNNNNSNNEDSTNNHERNGEQEDSNPGYWSGMLGSGGSW